MAKNPKSILKTYFQTGKVPTQGQYEDLIDSSLNLSETNTQTIQGEISSSTINVGFHITASGDISASGTIYSSTGSFSHINSPTDDNLFIESDKDIKIRIDSDGDESGHLRIYEGGSSNPFWQIKDDGKTVIGGSAINTSASAMLTVNGDISASNSSTLQIGTGSFGTIRSSSSQVGVNFETPITASEDIKCLGTIFGTLGTTSTITDVGTLTALNVNGNTLIAASTMQINMSSTHPLQITGSISSSGGLTVGEISASFLSSSYGISTLGDVRAKNLDIFNSASIDGSTTFGSTIKAANIGGATDTNNVIILNGSSLFKTRAIDSRVWGTTLLDTDGTGTNNELAIFKDANTVEGSANLTFDGSNLISAGNITAGGTVLGTKGIYTAITNIPQVVTWEDSGDITAQDFNNLHLKVEIRSMPVISPNKYTTTTEWMRIKHGAITAQSILIANSDNQGLTSVVSSHVGMHFFNVGNGYANFRFSNLAGEFTIPQGETTRFNIMILSR